MTAAQSSSETKRPVLDRHALAAPVPLPSKRKAKSMRTLQRLAAERKRRQAEDAFLVFRLIRIVGGREQVLAALGSSLDSFKKWSTQGIPLRYHLAIEELTRGEITVEMLAESRGLRLPSLRGHKAFGLRKSKPQKAGGFGD